MSIKFDGLLVFVRALKFNFEVENHQSFIAFCK